MRDYTTIILSFMEDCTSWLMRYLKDLLQLPVCLCPVSATVLSQNTWWLLGSLKRKVNTHHECTKGDLERLGDEDTQCGSSVVAHQTAQSGS